MELNHKKILVTFLMHLGDLTLTTPFIHALRQAAPDSHISMLVDEKLKTWCCTIRIWTRC
jgi:heptosyltransferase-2